MRSPDDEKRLGVAPRVLGDPALAFQGPVEGFQDDGRGGPRIAGFADPFQELVDEGRQMKTRGSGRDETVRRFLKRCGLPAAATLLSSFPGRQVESETRRDGDVARPLDRHVLDGPGHGLVVGAAQPDDLPGEPAPVDDDQHFALES